MKRKGSYLVNTLLASCALYFAQGLSRGDRHAIDWVVLGLLACALLWNLVRLAQRLYAGGGAADAWQVTRTAGFWLIGLLNTAWIRPEDVGSWKNFLGWVVLVIAAADTVALHRKERAALRPTADAKSA